jgi:hypothetical protein
MTYSRPEADEVMPKGLPPELHGRGPMTPDRLREIFDGLPEVHPEIIAPKTCSLPFAEWQQRERRRMAGEKAGHEGKPRTAQQGF